MKKNHHNSQKNAFTLIEILVVIVIMSLLVSAGAVSYQSFNKQGRDAKRKADLEQIRGALELYRSSVGNYPAASGTFGMAFGTGSLSDGTNTYMSRIPQDPKSTQSYYYTVSGNEYTIAAILDNAPVPTCAVSGTNCLQSGSQGCNYCLGPYGEK